MSRSYIALESIMFTKIFRFWRDFDPAIRTKCEKNSVDSDREELREPRKIRDEIFTKFLLMQKSSVVFKVIL